MLWYGLVLVLAVICFVFGFFSAFAFAFDTNGRVAAAVLVGTRRSGCGGGEVGERGFSGHTHTYTPSHS